jgi:hypothetical protein
LVFDLSQESAALKFEIMAVARLMCFVTTWTIGPGTVCQLAIAELYPSNVRGVAMGATAFLWALTCSARRRF